MAIAVDPRAREDDSLTTHELEKLLTVVAKEPELGNVKAMRAAGIREHYTNGALKALLDQDVIEQLREVRGEPAKKALHMVAASPWHKHWPTAIRAVLPAYGGAEFQENHRVELVGEGGGPVVIEGRAVVGLADVNRLAAELGLGDLVGLDAGDPRRELAPAPDVLPGS